ncbi:MAG: VCBS repeat-containing protein [Ferruginibacter sp.]|nr:VCBS repeat-containing protein [Ferruginibacter sp.]
MNKYAVLFILFIGITYATPAQPVISDFNPASGPIGSTVTITGTGFSSIPANNTVYFGSAKATVTSANSNSLSVTVPTGSSDEPITVTVNGLTAYSLVPFSVTFTGVGPFTQVSFAPKVTVSTTPSNPSQISAADLDGDNKAELITASYSGSSISIFKNNSNISNLDFTFRVNIPVGSNPSYLTVADVDGDGMKDIIIGIVSSVVPTTNKFTVLRNTSSAGSISFAPQIDFAIPGNGYSYEAHLGEIDGDGKPDVVILEGTGIQIFRNTSIPGSISLTPPVAIGVTANGIAIADMNANGKAELIITKNMPASQLAIYNNISTPGTISFDAPVLFNTPLSPVGIAVGNLDNDNKPDIAITNTDNYSISVFKNTSTGPAITLDTRQDFSAGVNPWDIRIADIDGDSKFDVITSYVIAGSPIISLFRNIGTGGSIQLAGKVDYATEISPQFIAIADLNNDGRLDLAATQNSLQSLVIFRNKIGDPPNITSFTPTSAWAGNIIAIRGTNLGDATAVSFGGIASVSLQIYSDTLLYASVGAGATGNVSVTTLSGSASAPGFTFNNTLNILSVSPMKGPYSQRVKIIGSGFSTTPANNIVHFGGVKATVNSATSTMLNVTVPPGALYRRVSVTVGNFTAWSEQPYNITFDSGVVNNNMFIRRINIDAPSSNGVLELADMDSDGLNDIVSNYYGEVHILRNTTTDGIVSFFSGTGFLASTSNIALADFNGDGKIDVISVSPGTEKLYPIRNTSTPGTISFSGPNPGETVNIGGTPIHATASDLDRDGKPDLVVAFPNTQTIAVLRNISTPSLILFATPQYFPIIGNNTYHIAVGDINGDGKSDIIIPNKSTNIFSVYQNTSNPGLITLAARQDFNAGTPTGYAAIADMDGDNNPDVLLAASSYMGSGTVLDTGIVIFRNLSTQGNISFAPRFALKQFASWGITISDLNGDAKPDILANYKDSVYMIRNLSSSGTLSFDTTSRFILGGSSTSSAGLAAGDLDGDGIPDVTIANGGISKHSVLINQNSPVLGLCPPFGMDFLISNIVPAISYQWQVNTGNGFTNVVNGSNYSGANGSVLQLINIPSSWTGYKYRCIAGFLNGSLTSKPFTIRFINTWTGANSTAWEDPGNWSCNSVPDINTDVVINAGTVIINSNVTIRTLRLSPDVTLTVNPGYTLTITH